jgi:hypothetical protein
MDDLEGLHCGLPSLVPSESIQPLEHRLNVVLLQKLLGEFLCVALSQAIPTPNRTH